MHPCPKVTTTADYNITFRYASASTAQADIFLNAPTCDVQGGKDALLGSLLMPDSGGEAGPFSRTIPLTVRQCLYCMLRGYFGDEHCARISPLNRSLTLFVYHEECKSRLFIEWEKPISTTTGFLFDASSTHPSTPLYVHIRLHARDAFRCLSARYIAPNQSDPSQSGAARHSRMRGNRRFHPRQDGFRSPNHRDVQ